MLQKYGKRAIFVLKLFTSSWRLCTCLSPTWASGLSASGLYYQGILDRNQLEVLELHKRDTVSTFGTRSSFRVTSGAKAVEGLEKSTREVLEAEKENHSTQSSTKEQVRVHCHKLFGGGGGGGDII